MSSNFYKIHKGVTLNPQTGADPSPAQNGDMYYNLTLQKFRKYENGAWSDFDSGAGTNVDDILVSDDGDVVTANGYVLTQG